MTEEKDPFKKQYMLTSMKLMMSNSFYRKRWGAQLNAGGNKENNRRIHE